MKFKKSNYSFLVSRPSLLRLSVFQGHQEYFKPYLNILRHPSIFFFNIIIIVFCQRIVLCLVNNPMLLYYNPFLQVQVAVTQLN